MSSWKFLRKLGSDYLIETKQNNLPHHVDCPDYIISKLTILQTLQWSETAVLCNFTWASSLASGRIKVETSTAWLPQPGCARPRQKSTNTSLILPPLYHNRNVFNWGYLCQSFIFAGSRFSVARTRELGSWFIRLCVPLCAGNLATEAGCFWNILFVHHWVWQLKFSVLYWFLFLSRKSALWDWVWGENIKDSVLLLVKHNWSQFQSIGEQETVMVILIHYCDSSVQGTEM